jgi:tRNA U38,U39,U40 pseudouridine synthase TruA
VFSASLAFLTHNSICGISLLCANIAPCVHVQVIHFDLPASGASAPRDNAAAIALLQYCLNQMLPEDVRVFGLRPAPPPPPPQVLRRLPWSCNLNATGKLYTYRLAVSDVLNPLHARQRAHYSPALWPIDVDALEQTL